MKRFENKFLHFLKILINGGGGGGGGAGSGFEWTP